MIDKVTKVVNLYDVYGALLTQRQRELVEMYYFDDWSLAEIAEHLGVSRQAVHDHLRRAEEQLDSYEATLGMFESSKARLLRVQALVALWERARDFVPEDLRFDIECKLDALKEEPRPTEGGEEHA